MAASFLATPYAQLADLPLVTSAAILLTQERACADGVLRTGQIAVLVLAFLLPYMLMASFPVGPAVIGLLLAVAVASRPEGGSAPATLTESTVARGWRAK